MTDLPTAALLLACPVALVAAGTPSSEAPAAPLEAAAQARLRRILEDHHALAFRVLRRLGVSDAWVDDAVSRVFDVVVRRLEDIEAGRERAFVAEVAVRVAADARRAHRRRQALETTLETDVANLVSGAASPEDALQRRQAMVALDLVLEGIEPDARGVFVLHEIEQFTMAEIAASLGIPAGTVASRLRRGRSQFEQAAEVVRRRMDDMRRGDTR